jgi:hypothetical protein
MTAMGRLHRPLSKSSKEIGRVNERGHLLERRLVMPNEFVLRMEENSVRFTPRGEIAVIDAIKALSESDTAEEIWQTLKKENPQILSHCRRFNFAKNKSALVVDGQGWERIESLLFDYILDRSLLQYSSTI